MEKNINSLLSGRIDPDLTISKTTYLGGLVDIVDFLLTELRSLMENEGRFMGIVKSYFHSISEAYTKINENYSEEKETEYGKILYLLKPSIRKEYFWLVKTKNLSKADADIVIINKLLEIIISDCTGYEYKKEIKTVAKVIKRLFDNIKNKGKESPMFNFCDLVRYCINSGVAGKYSSDKLSLSELEKTPLLKSGVRIKNDTKDKIIEITLD